MLIFQNDKNGPHVTWFA